MMKQKNKISENNKANVNGQMVLHQFGLNIKSIINKKIHSEMNNYTFNQTFLRIFSTVFVLIVCLFSVHAQETVTISGIIVTPENKPVPDVTVSVEGSREMPAFTNEAGEFTVQAEDLDQWIIVAPAANFKRKRVYIGGRTELRISVTPDDLTSGSDELVLLQQTVERRNLASSYSAIDLSNVHHAITTSIDQHMQGRVAGMHVINQSGAPGSGAVTYLRGIRSLNASNNPLYVVDGMIMEPKGLFGSVISGYSYNPLLSLNPLDVSNAAVMKDAVYSAAYGSKASNGLVMIQTLDPSATETSFEVDMRRGLSLKPQRYIPQLNAQQHKTLANEVIISSGVYEETIYDIFQNMFLEKTDERFIDYQHDTDWQQFIFEDASFTNFNAKIKGGDEIARYGLSFGYYNSNGIIKSTKFDGYNLRFVSLVNIFTWLRMNANVSFSTSDSDLKESRARETSPIMTSLAKSPMLYPYQYDSEGLETRLISEVDELGVSNPVATIDNFTANSKNYQIITSIGLEADILNDFLFKTNVGILYNTLKEQMFMPNRGMERYYDNEAHNVSKASTNTYSGFTNNSQLIYNKRINSEHLVNSTTGMNIMINQFQYDWGLTKNSHRNDHYRMLQDGINNLREMGGETRNWNWLSVYEKLTYTYQDKYIATATVSLDGSSRIGSDAENTVKIFNNPFGLFYSGGLGWRVSNESFLNDIYWLEELMLRGSMGRTGNDDIGESNASKYYQTLHYRATTGIVPASIANNKLTYETVDQLNAGLDLSLFANRVRFTFDVFKNTTNNMLIYQPLESYFGYRYRPENSGSMENTGWEAYTYLRVLNLPNFKWSIEANFSQTSNVLTSIAEDIQITTMDSYELVNEVGSPANSFYGYVFDGVYSSTEQALEAGVVNNKGVPYRAGDAIFQDISGPNGEPDGVINRFDKVAIGSSMPDFIGGLSNTFKYKNWTLSAFVNVVLGVDVYNFVRFQNESMSGLVNQSSNVLNRWQFEGQQTSVPRALWNDPIGNSVFSSRWIEDASYLRLKNVSLSYKIPDEFLLFKNAEFYVSASNLITLSNYLGYDPEFAYSYNILDRGIDYGQSPMPRQFLVGIKLGL
jgi:TonB-linked SusC/RagA family outer membrane protein